MAFEPKETDTLGLDIAGFDQPADNSGDTSANTSAGQAECPRDGESADSSDQQEETSDEDGDDSEDLEWEDVDLSIRASPKHNRPDTGVEQMTEDFSHDDPAAHRQTEATSDVDPAEQSGQQLEALTPTSHFSDSSSSEDESTGAAKESGPFSQTGSESTDVFEENATFENASNHALPVFGDEGASENPPIDVTQSSSDQGRGFSIDDMMRLNEEYDRGFYYDYRPRSPVLAINGGEDIVQHRYLLYWEGKIPIPSTEPRKRNPNPGTDVYPRPTMPSRPSSLRRVRSLDEVSPEVSPESSATKSGGSQDKIVDQQTPQEDSSSLGHDIQPSGENKSEVTRVEELATTVPAHGSVATASHDDNEHTNGANGSKGQPPSGHSSTDTSTDGAIGEDFSTPTWYQPSGSSWADEDEEDDYKAIQDSLSDLTRRTSEERERRESLQNGKVGHDDEDGKPLPQRTGSLDQGTEDPDASSPKSDTSFESTAGMSQTEGLQRSQEYHESSSGKLALLRYDLRAKAGHDRSVSRIPQDPQEHVDILQAKIHEYRRERDEALRQQKEATKKLTEVVQAHNEAVDNQNEAIEWADSQAAAKAELEEEMAILRKEIQKQYEDAERAKQREQELMQAERRHGETTMHSRTTSTEHLPVASSSISETHSSHAAKDAVMDSRFPTPEETETRRPQHNHITGPETNPFISLSPRSRWSQQQARLRPHIGPLWPQQGRDLVAHNIAEWINEAHEHESGPPDTPLTQDRVETLLADGETPFHQLVGSLQDAGYLFRVDRFAQAVEEVTRREYLEANLEAMYEARRLGDVNESREHPAHRLLGEIDRLLEQIERLRDNSSNENDFLLLHNELAAHHLQSADTQDALERQLENCQRSRRELTGRNAELTEQVQALAALSPPRGDVDYQELEQLKADLNECRDHGRDLDMDVHDLREDKFQLEKALKAAEQQASDRQKENTSLLDQLKHCRELREKLSKLLNVASEDKARLLKENTDLSGKTDGLAKRLGELEKELGAAKVDASRDQGASNADHDRLVELEAEVIRLEAAHDTHMAMLQAAKTHIDKVETTAHDFANENEELKDRIKAIERAGTGTPRPSAPAITKLFVTRPEDPSSIDGVLASPPPLPRSPELGSLSPTRLRDASSPRQTSPPMSPAPLATDRQQAAWTNREERLRNTDAYKRIMQRHRLERLEEERRQQDDWALRERAYRSLFGWPSIDYSRARSRKARLTEWAKPVEVR